MPHLLLPSCLVGMVFYAQQTLHKALKNSVNSSDAASIRLSENLFKDTHNHWKCKGYILKKTVHKQQKHPK